ncbi:MAG: RPB7/RPC8 family DNA-directed RNA polymerase subunit, partial [Promethearchaeota archaeon]
MLCYIWITNIYSFYWCIKIFKIYSISTKVEIPPFLFNQPKATSARIILSEEYEGIITRDYGFIIAIVDVLEVGQGI